jgi:hypothetical protein
MQSVDGNYSVVISTGVSKSSMAGDKSYGVNGMIWSTLDQYVLSANYTKMDFEKGKLNNIHSYGGSVAYLKGSWMVLTTYTLIKPHPKFGTYGLNVGGIGLVTSSPEGKIDVSISTSLVGFWTKPYQINNKLTLSPQIFIMSTPINYQPSFGTTMVSRDFGFLVGSSFDYKLSKRFGLSLNYKANGSTSPGSTILHNFLIGSRMIL